MTFRNSRSRRLRAGVTLLLAIPATGALADESTEREEKRWQVVLGAGVRSEPEYPGSGKDEVKAMPVLNIRYGRFFLGGVPGGGGAGAGLGAYLYDNDSWSFGAVVATELGEVREESDDARLQGLGDIDGTVRAGVFASYEPTSWLTLRGNALSDVGGKDQGLIASFEMEASYQPYPRLRLTAGPGITWGDDEYAQTLYGIDAQQSLRSGFGQYDPGSSATVARFSVGAQYAFTPKWILGSRITASRLLGDAADSPIVEDENQNTYALFMMYRF
jgi:outer membrane protein